MKKLIFLSIAIMAVVFGLSYKVTHALFLDNAISANNSFTAAATFPTPTSSITPTEVPVSTPTPTPTGHVVINEVSAVGGNNDDWIELYNPTASTVDLSGWKITDNSSTAEIIPSNSFIPAGGYAVLTASPSVVLVPNSATHIALNTSAIGNGLAAGGESLLLQMSDNTTVDALSWGSDVTYFVLPAMTSTNSLARQPNGQDTDLFGDWGLDLTPSVGVSN